MRNSRLGQARQGLGNSDDSDDDGNRVYLESEDRVTADFGLSKSKDSNISLAQFGTGSVDKSVGGDKRASESIALSQKTASLVVIRNQHELSVNDTGQTDVTVDRRGAVMEEQKIAHKNQARISEMVETRKPSAHYMMGGGTMEMEFDKADEIMIQEEDDSSSSQGERTLATLDADALKADKKHFDVMDPDHNSAIWAKNPKQQAAAAQQQQSKQRSMIETTAKNDSGSSLLYDKTLTYTEMFTNDAAGSQAGFSRSTQGQQNLLNQIEQHTQEKKLAEIMAHFEFHVAVIGGPAVGKTNMLHKIVNNYLEPSQDGDSVISISQETLKHTLKAKSGEEVNVVFFDTKGHYVKSTMNQFYRNKQGFIVMCDLSDEYSIKGVTQWLHEIEERSSIHDSLIMVLANKCDLLNEIDQDCVYELEMCLRKDFPTVIYREISVRFNLEVQESIQILADQLQENKPSYAQQRLDLLIRHNSFSRASRNFVIQDPSQGGGGSDPVSQFKNKLANSQREKNSRAPSVAVFEQRQLYYGSLILSADGSYESEAQQSGVKKKKKGCCKGQ